MRKALSLLLLLALLSTTAFAQNVNAAGDSITYKTESNILYKRAADEQITDLIKKFCVLDIYYPENVKNFTTVIWIHGGGMTMGSRYIPDDLKGKGIAVVAVGYRLNPAVKCPVYIEDVAAAAAWTFNNIAKYGGDPGKIILSGHSAGGYLALMVGLDKSWLAKHNIDADRIAALIPFSAQTITHFTIRSERNIPDYQPLIDEFAPLYHVRKDAPPLIIITGDRKLESMARYEENLYLMRMMQEVGHPKTTLLEMNGSDHMEMLSPGYYILLKSIKDINK